MLDWENQSRATQPERQKKNKQGRVGVALTKWAFQGLKENRAIFGAFGALKGRGTDEGRCNELISSGLSPGIFTPSYVGSGIGRSSNVGRKMGNAMAKSNG